MERLRSRLNIPRNEGYLLDDEREGRNFVAFWLFGWIGLVLKLFYRHSLQPLTSKVVGEMKERELEHVLKEYPESLTCPYCNHLIKRK